MEHGTNKPPVTERAQERSKGEATSPTTSQNPSRWHPSWLSNACTTRKDAESERSAKDNPEMNPITIKLETVSHTAEQFSWVPIHLPNKVCCFISMCVSSDNLFLSVRQDKNPLSGPGRGPHSCNTFTCYLHILQIVWT